MNSILVQFFLILLMTPTLHHGCGTSTGNPASKKGPPKTQPDEPTPLENSLQIAAPINAASPAVLNTSFSTGNQAVGVQAALLDEDTSSEGGALTDFCSQIAGNVFTTNESYLGTFDFDLDFVDVEVELRGGSSESTWTLLESNGEGEGLTESESAQELCELIQEGRSLSANQPHTVARTFTNLDSLSTVKDKGTPPNTKLQWTSKVNGSTTYRFPNPWEAITEEIDGTSGTEIVSHRRTFTIDSMNISDSLQTSVGSNASATAQTYTISVGEPQEVELISGPADPADIQGIKYTNVRFQAQLAGVEETISIHYENVVFTRESPCRPTGKITVTHGQESYTVDFNNVAANQLPQAVFSDGTKADYLVCMPF